MLAAIAVAAPAGALENDRIVTKPTTATSLRIAPDSRLWRFAEGISEGYQHGRHGDDPGDRAVREARRFLPRAAVRRRHENRASRPDPLRLKGPRDARRLR